MRLNSSLRRGAGEETRPGPRRLPQTLFSPFIIFAQAGLDLLRIRGRVVQSGLQLLIGQPVEGPPQPVPGPGQRNAADGTRISPWNYVSTNPTNNQEGGFDLWLDVTYSGRINRISNWSKDPQAQ